ncbi:alpha/beta hydrolase [Fodinibius sp.]|uniref:alpha/beta hydrolase n=1 Tax=Fodinibius sp. TaxID=1872440 RepID=UPI002ACE6802|nr:alpha/beta hydrolase [Fodinibius sp.]MDZ7658405.1 alpha/beta hydrolase [Fodinibius sp.]
MQSFLWILLSIAVGYLLLVVLMYLLQSQMIYYPQKSITYTPEDVGLSYEDVTFTTEDGVSLHGWYIPTSSNITVLYFHGNAGNISGRLQTIQLLHNLGLNVFIFDYRGYGKSEGKPSEQGTYKDARAAWNYLVAEKDIDNDQIVIMGRSLGGAVGSWLAVQKQPAATILESTFTSAADLGADLYSWLPVRSIIRYDYNTLENVKQIRSPLFMAHSREDEIVPYEHGEKLFEVANEPKTFVELRGSHGSGFWETGEKYRTALQEFLNDNITN